MPMCVLMWIAICFLGGAAVAIEPERQEWRVDGVTREGLVYAPATAIIASAPVIFAFHGHGGTMKNAARSFAYHTEWPEAITVYLQGLNTPGKLTDPEGKKPGWQSSPGDQQDRDLKFYDIVLASLKKDYKVDDKRIFSTGHSNGGGFTYLLWATRGDTLTAVAPSAAISNQNIKDLKPKPVLHVAGEKDTLVKYDWQLRTIDAVRKLNGTYGDGQPWEKLGKVYPSKSNTPVLTYIHSGGHNFPSDAPALIVKFFKEQGKSR